MSDQQKQENVEFTRRALMELGTISGLGAIAALSGGISPAGAVEAAGPAVGPQALGAQLPGLTYIGLDALAFWPVVASQRIYQDITGVQGNANDRIWAPLSLPVGSTISQISASYQVQPIIEISRRPMFSGVTATAPIQVFQQSFPASPGGPFASTVNLSPAVVITAGATYLVSAFLTPGSSIIGVQLGYRPPTQSFVPFTGASPRIFNSVTSGGPLLPGVSRTVFLGRTGVVGCVFNLIVYGAPQAGAVSAYPANIAPPNTPSVQFGANQKTQTLVISLVDSTGSIKLLSSGSSPNAVIDVVGYLV